MPDSITCEQLYASTTMYDSSIEDLLFRFMTCEDSDTYDTTSINSEHKRLIELLKPFLSLYKSIIYQQYSLHETGKELYARLFRPLVYTHSICQSFNQLDRDIEDLAKISACLCYIFDIIKLYEDNCNLPQEIKSRIEEVFNKHYPNNDSLTNSYDGVLSAMKLIYVIFNYNQPRDDEIYAYNERLWLAQSIVHDAVKLSRLGVGAMNDIVHRYSSKVSQAGDFRNGMKMLLRCKVMLRSASGMRTEYGKMMAKKLYNEMVEITNDETKLNDFLAHYTSTSS